MTATADNALQLALPHFPERAQPKRMRTMGEFAQQCVVLPPGGPRSGRLLRYEWQPWLRHWLEMIDIAQGRFDFNAVPKSKRPYYEQLREALRYVRQFMLTGTSQAGKTLGGSCIPILYHTFEEREPGIYGVPDINMKADKWSDDLMPVIESSEFVSELPRTGPGSRGGTAPTRVKFQNGVWLRFMTGGGNDQARAGKTAKRLYVTELSGWGDSQETSKEGSKLDQLLARLNANLNESIAYTEGTLQDSEGVTWKEYKRGTGTYLVYACHQCGKTVRPERVHLVGWHDSEDDVEAQENSRWSCPECAKTWQEDERRDMLQHGRLMHRGQTINKKGEIEGVLPRTRLCSFRYMAFDNLFMPAGELGAKEWEATQNPDGDKKERALKQFFHGMYHDGEIEDVSRAEYRAIIKRIGTHNRGQVPADAAATCMAVDIGKWRCHWSWRADTGAVINYGLLQPLSGQIGVHEAVLTALREHGEWIMQLPRLPDIVLCDCRYQQKAVFKWVEEMNESDGGNPGYWPRFVAVRGWGMSQSMAGKYTAPKSKTKVIREVGDGFNLQQERADVYVLNADADHWKTVVHEALNLPVDRPGATTLFQVAKPIEHGAFAKQLSSEESKQVFDPDKAKVVLQWEQKQKDNHWFDTTYMNHLGIAFLDHVAETDPSGGNSATQDAWFRKGSQ